MERVTGPLTKGMMEYAHDALNMKPVNWDKPSGVQSLSAYVVRNHIGLGSVEPSPSNDLFPSWYKQKSGGNSSQTVDKVSGKLATSCTPDAAKITRGGANANIYSADIFVGGSNASNVTSTDDVHKCDDTKPSVTVTAPAACDTSTGCDVTVTVTAGTHAISSSQYPGTVNLYVNDNKVQSQTVSNSPATLTFHYTPSGAGAGVFRAEVIDSVLYSGTNDASTTFASPSGNNGNGNGNGGNNNENEDNN
jgi:hypothetical protein